MAGRKKKVKNLRPTLDIAQSTGIRNAASTLLANIDFSSVDKPIQSICITSATPNEGKTTTALSLAAAIGQSGRTCLLIEGDMRRRSLRAALNVHPTAGLHAVLTGASTIDNAVVGTSLMNVYFLDAEPGIPNPEAIISSKHFKAMLEQLCRTFNFVIFDTPPVAAFADAVVLSRLVDGTILVLREGQTKRQDALLATEQMQSVGANLLGIVLNGVKAGSGGGYDYYYGYYYEEKTVPEGSPEAVEALKTAAKYTSGSAKKKPASKSPISAVKIGRHGKE
ncbi:Tyrosine-protein kinase YwqD [Slackia heliotrinireducens]|uniref:Capsular exopolysaccharide biosynthesis protein n=1 Tax=Slackia heliotrinireducens (strain ATCC 29202 / DSM 20476 / NCTC 11029 / RHS 1) TaxID=471855 RepID=C7N5W9_SLAHD|nr:CpsD/CapB family tyrosine-protein kinase [Slackia heliotrinireducens]ACV22304.1 capsular exopolysaccharide biosynthesis protein [Slackia heliotrinireducens DSM 20476]VEH00512.1 Tyrosine-protein kinase YwqD [Slackia heliotrinireducens]